MLKNLNSGDSKQKMMKSNIAIAELTNSYQKILKNAEFLLKNIK